MAPPSVEVLEGRAMLLKDWTRYKTKQFNETVSIVEGMIRHQEKALEKLRNESEDLYQAAIEVLIIIKNNFINRKKYICIRINTV